MNENRFQQKHVSLVGRKPASIDNWETFERRVIELILEVPVTWSSAYLALFIDLFSLERYMFNYKSSMYLMM